MSVGEIMDCSTEDCMNIDNAAPLGIALLGLLLGMRHATDPTT